VHGVRHCLNETMYDVCVEGPGELLHRMMMIKWVVSRQKTIYTKRLPLMPPEHADPCYITPKIVHANNAKGICRNATLKNTHLHTTFGNSLANDALIGPLSLNIEDTHGHFPTP